MGHDVATRPSGSRGEVAGRSCSGRRASIWVTIVKSTVELRDVDEPTHAARIGRTCPNSRVHPVQLTNSKIHKHTHHDPLQTTSALSFPQIA